MVGIVDYEVGNLQSIINAFNSLHVKVRLESDPDKLKKYDKIILPGVGAFGNAMRSLEQKGMKEAVLEFAKSGKYLLGICLGMQLLMEKSFEFGENRGLGLVKGQVVKFNQSKFKEHLKIPHIGWNSLHVKQKSFFLKDLKKDIYLYFVHSFYVKCEKKFVIGTTHYGYDFTSSLQKENIIGIQCHPEKSHKNGLKILENFSKI